MINLYNSNGLVFWTEEEIRFREMLVDWFSSSMTRILKELNPAFDLIRVEASALTPMALVNQEYLNAGNIFKIDEELALRPETTAGSYVYLQELLNTHNKRRVRLPVCVWQHGKSFRNEQDKVLKHMRLKEFHQLEFQIAFSNTTKADYAAVVVPAVCDMIAEMIGPCKVVDSDRIPHYSAWTKDVVFQANDMELCSISRRKDCQLAEIIEVAVGTDRCVHNFFDK